MTLIPSHSARQALTDELHARPFTPVKAPAQIVYLALKAEDGAAARGPEGDLAHLNALLDQLGAPLVEPVGGVTPSVHIAEFDRFRVKWERHAEFVAYALTRDEQGPEPFNPGLASIFSQDWLASGPGPAISAALFDVTAAESAEEGERMLREQITREFNPASLAAAWVTERSAIAATDFRIDANGFTRFAVIAMPGVGPRRVGRVSQRLFELETYRALSMLGLPLARSLSPRLAIIDRSLAQVADQIASGARGDRGPRADVDERAALERLTSLAAEVERISAEGAYRFGAARAYQAIVTERLTVLSEARVAGLQTFEEFMIRRYKPAMRTCHSAEDRIVALAARAERSANLLRTRVDVTLEAQNQKLLESMDRRAQLQLRLQQTVEGLSVVAISYYAVSLAGYVLAPFAKSLGLTEPKYMTAIVALPIIAAVWLMVRSIRAHADHEERAVQGGSETSEAGDKAVGTGLRAAARRILARLKGSAAKGEGR